MPFTGDDYEKLPNLYCSAYPTQTYPKTLSEAKIQRSGDASCTMFYDVEAEGAKFPFCDDGTEIKVSISGSILYIKRSKYAFMCKPLL